MIDPCELARELGLDETDCHRAFHDEVDFIAKNGSTYERVDPHPVAAERIAEWYEEGRRFETEEWINHIGVSSFAADYRWSRVWATLEGLKAAGVKEVKL